MNLQKEFANLKNICIFLSKFGGNRNKILFVVEKDIFSVKIAIFIAEIDLRYSITLRHPDYIIPILNNFH